MLGEIFNHKMPDDWVEQMARNENAGPIAMSFAKVLDAERKLHELRIEQLESIVKNVKHPE